MGCVGAAGSIATIIITGLTEGPSLTLPAVVGYLAAYLVTILAVIPCGIIFGMFHGYVALRDTSEPGSTMAAGMEYIKHGWDGLDNHIQAVKKNHAKNVAEEKRVSLAARDSILLALSLLGPESLKKILKKPCDHERDIYPLIGATVVESAIGLINREYNVDHRAVLYRKTGAKPGAADPKTLSIGHVSKNNRQTNVTGAIAIEKSIAGLAMTRGDMFIYSEHKSKKPELKLIPRTYCRPSVAPKCATMYIPLTSHRENPSGVGIKLKENHSTRADNESIDEWGVWGVLAIDVPGKIAYNFTTELLTFVFIVAEIMNTARDIAIKGLAPGKLDVPDPYLYRLAAQPKIIEEAAKWRARCIDLQKQKS